MINTFLVDDERPALRELAYFLSSYPEVSITGIFTNPLEAIEKVKVLQPQLVFLDINMPQLQGIDAAAKILDYCENVNIVFVTAHDQYAIEAFELYALDYLLKPINEERLVKTIERLRRKKDFKTTINNKKLQIRCLGRFQVGWEKEEPIKWRTEKTKELFAFLLHNKGREMSKDEIIDNLWTEDEPEKALRQLYNGIYYIRKALQEYGINKSMIFIRSNYSLKLELVHTDTAIFYEEMKNGTYITKKRLEELEALYAGDYYEGEDWPWADLERENLAELYQRCLLKLSEKYIDSKQFDRAETTLKKAYHKNPYEEVITEFLLKLYLKTGEKSKASRHYLNLSKLLWEDLGIKPQEKLQKLYQSIK